jgi:uncharacterized protein (DUF2141 family)
MPTGVVIATVLLAAGTLTVQTVGLDSEEGVVACALHDSADGFPGGETVRAERLPIQGRAAVWTIDEVAAGEYAVSCYHDRNGNGKLDKNVLGVPSEPYGFSNDARGTLGPPKYKKARFRHDGGATTIEIRLR